MPLQTRICDTLKIGSLSKQTDEEKTEEATPDCRERCASPRGDRWKSQTQRANRCDNQEWSVAVEVGIGHRTEKVLAALFLARSSFTFSSQSQGPAPKGRDEICVRRVIRGDMRAEPVHLKTQQEGMRGAAAPGGNTQPLRSLKARAHPCERRPGPPHTGGSGPLTQNRSLTAEATRPHSETRSIREEKVDTETHHEKMATIRGIRKELWESLTGPHGKSGENRVPNLTGSFEKETGVEKCSLMAKCLLNKHSVDGPQVTMERTHLHHR